MPPKKKLVKTFTLQLKAGSATQLRRLVPRSVSTA